MGLVIATELVDRGHQVELRDPVAQFGPHACSWWAGGMLAPDCERESAPEAVARLGRSSIDWWSRHISGVQHHGSLVLALSRDRGDLEHFARLSDNGQRLDGDAIAELEPDLAGRFQRGLFYAQEAHLTPRLALQELRARLEAAGASFVVSSEAPDSGQVIDCRGLAARDALPDLRGVRGEVLTLSCPELDLKRPIRLLHPRTSLYVIPRGAGIYMLGATMIESDDRGPITARSLHDLLAAAWSLHPAFGEARLVETGADARPAFDDNLPHIRHHQGRLYANGLFRHGYLLSPPLACMVADHLEGAQQLEWLDVEELV